MSSSELDSQASLIADSMLQTLGDGNSPDFTQFHDRMQAALRGFVQRRLPDVLQRQHGASDIMQSALLSFWKVCERRNLKCDPTDSSEDLWPLLLTIARRKITAATRRVTAAKRGGNMQRSRTAADDVSEAAQSAALDLIERQLEMDVDHVLGQFDPDTQTVAALKLAGATNSEIAEALDCTVRRVERKGTLLRAAFNEYFQSADADT